MILVGVSRSGKTPTSLYLALQFGVKAANYPLIPEDFHRMQLPEALRSQKTKLYGLTIAPERLREIRQERRPDSRYADLDNCRFEIDEAEKLMRREGIRCDQLDQQVDRGDRHHDPAGAQDRAARLLAPAISELPSFLRAAHRGEQLVGLVSGLLQVEAPAANRLVYLVQNLLPSIRQEPMCVSRGGAVVEARCSVLLINSGAWCGQRVFARSAP